MRLWFCLIILSIDIQISDALEKNAGIYFRLNQKAVDYITDLASDAMPQILNNMHLPDISVGPATISKIHLNEVKKPDIRAKFVKNKGVKANITLPLVRTSAEAAVDMFFPIEGSFIVELHNFTVGMELHFSRNEPLGMNIIEIPYCETKHSDLIIRLEEDSTLTLIQDQLESAIANAVKSKICETTLEAAKYIEAQELETAVQPPTHDTFSEQSPFSPVEFGSSLCEVQRIDNMDVSSTTSSLSFNETTVSPSWGANLELVYTPKFSDEDVVFGLDGGIRYNNSAASDVDQPRTLNVSVLDKRMIGILLSDYIPNTLFSHIFDNNMGYIHERLETGHLPKSIRKIGNMLCSKCYLDITAHLTDKPRVEIDDKLGARMELAGNVTVLFHGRQELHDLIHASTRLQITLKPSIRHSRLYGDVSLTNVDINVFDLGVGGPLAKPVEKLISLAVPRVLWPQVKKRLRFALNKRGIKLPVLCGVELEHLTLDYIDHAAVINTDFTFDLPLFVRKFKHYLTQKAEIHAKMPKYVEL